MAKGGINKVILVGNLGQDPEVKYTPSGDCVANVSLATSESWKDKSGEQQERTEWHRLVFWRKLAEIAGQYLRKGSKVYIEGKLETRSWETESGEKRYMTEINVRDMLMLGGKEEGRGEAWPPGGQAAAQGEAWPGGEASRPAPGHQSGPGDDDDLPF